MIPCFFHNKRPCNIRRGFESSPGYHISVGSSTEVLFFCKKSTPNHPHLIFNGIVVERVKEQKHLGLVLESSLSFEKHLNEKIINAKKNVGILKHLSKFLPLKTLDQNVQSPCSFSS